MQGACRNPGCSRWCEPRRERCGRGPLVNRHHHTERDPAGCDARPYPAGRPRVCQIFPAGQRHALQRREGSERCRGAAGAQHGDAGKALPEQPPVSCTAGGRPIAMRATPDGPADRCRFSICRVTKQSGSMRAEMQCSQQVSSHEIAQGLGFRVSSVDELLAHCCGVSGSATSQTSRTSGLDKADGRLLHPAVSPGSWGTSMALRTPRWHRRS